jgi:hypothetical protein
MKVVTEGLSLSQLADWIQAEPDIEVISMNDALQSGEDVVFVRRAVLFNGTDPSKSTSEILIARGRVYSSDKDAIKNLKGRNKARAKPKTDGAFHSQAVAICRWFYALPGREKPSKRTEAERVLNEVRLVLQEDMPETPAEQRYDRLQHILAGAAGDDFWSRQIISLGGVRKKMPNGRRKWQNAEAGLATTGSGTKQYSGGDTTWKSKYADE